MGRKKRVVWRRLSATSQVSTRNLHILISSGSHSAKIASNVELADSKTAFQSMKRDVIFDVQLYHKSYMNFKNDLIF